MQSRQWLATAATVLRKKPCWPCAMTWRWTPPTHYTLYSEYNERFDLIFTNSFNAIGSLFKSVKQFSQIWILTRSFRISLAMSRSSLAYILPRLYSLHQPQYPTTAQDVINSIAQCLLSSNHIFTFFSTSQKSCVSRSLFLSIYRNSEWRKTSCDVTPYNFNAL